MKNTCTFPECSFGENSDAKDPCIMSIYSDGADNFQKHTCACGLEASAKQHEYALRKLVEKGHLSQEEFDAHMEQMNTPGGKFFIVIGGHVDLDEPDHFVDSADKLDLVGSYDTYEKAKAAWKGKTGWTVDDATMRYFILPITTLNTPK